MRAGLLIFIFTLIITGCKNKNGVPRDIIPQKKMQAVFWDLMRADIFLGDFVLNKDSSLDKKTESIKLYEQIFYIHQINKEKFDKSFSYYRAHPVLFKAIMDSISQPKTVLQEEMIVQPIKPDSIPDIQQNEKDSIIPLRKKKGFQLN